MDYPPSVQQIAFVDTETGECVRRGGLHSDGEAERFYRGLKQRGIAVRVGMEATGHARWFERLLAELGYELWIGDPAQIKAARVKKQKTDRQDAPLLLRLWLEDRFPGVGVPSPENRDLRQLLWHRRVPMRTRIMNQLQAVALNEGVRRRKGLWSKRGRARLESFVLTPWARRRRQELLEVLDRLNPSIEELSAAVAQEAAKRPEVLRLMTPPGVGPLTALAFVLIIGSPQRFRGGKQIGNSLGLIPREDSSSDHRRWGHIPKQGNALLRYLLVEAVPSTVQRDPDWRRRFLHLAMPRDRRIAKGAMAGRLAVGLYGMWRPPWDYAQSLKFGSHAG